MTDGRPCGRPDEHKGRHHSPELMERRRAYARELNRQRALQSHPCSLKDCTEPARKLPSGKYGTVCVEHDREKSSRWKDVNPERLQAREKNRNVRDREAVFGHYGLACACCGSTERLTIDHVNGGGDVHRAEIGTKGGSGMYRWLIANGFPAGFQTLCMPCNRSKSDGPSCRLDHDGKAGRS